MDEFPYWDDEISAHYTFTFSIPCWAFYLSWYLHFYETLIEVLNFIPTIIMKTH